MKVVLATWNALADCYIHGQAGGADPDQSWANRSQLIKTCLVEAAEEVDIFCLQEIDHFDDFYASLLHSLGYTTVYMQRPMKNDGCLVAFRDSHFHLVATELIDLDQLSHLDRQLQRTGRSKFAKQNVSVLAVLRAKESGQELLAATCHLHWNPNLPEVKFAQAYYLIDRISAFREKHNGLPVVFTGDFNSLPHDEVVRFITGTAWAKATSFETIEKALAAQIESSSYTYGPNTKFLSDSSLNRLVRWLRMLGVDVAVESWDTMSSTNVSGKSGFFSPGTSVPGTPHSTNLSTKSNARNATINAFFQRARAEKRVILTTSKTLLQRAACPPAYYVHPGKLEEAIVEIYKEFGLVLAKERFLTVCGKCGGEIVETSPSDPRLEGKSLPTDRQVFICTVCGQPYWWSDLENSSPAKAMKQADALHDIIQQGLQRSATPAPASIPPPPPTSNSATPSLSTTETADEEKLNGNGKEEEEAMFLQHIRNWERDLEECVEDDDGHFVPLQSHVSSALPSFTCSPALAADMGHKTMLLDPASLSARFALRDNWLSSKTRLHEESVVEGLRGISLNSHNNMTCPDELEGRRISFVENGQGGNLSVKDMLPPLPHRAPPSLALAPASILTSGVIESESQRCHTPDTRAAELVELVSVFHALQQESPLTNWNGEFKGTLDYIFVTKDWEVQSAEVTPKVVSFPESGAIVQPAHDEQGLGRGMDAEVCGSQPSSHWPSDHFMIVTHLYLPQQANS